MAIVARQKLVSSSKYDIKCPYSMIPEFIVVHNTANDATANNEVTYMISNDNQVSFHYAVDDVEVVQGIPTDRNTWNAGDGRSGAGNRKGISIEICFSKSGGTRFENAEKLASKFIAQELKARGWGIDKVKKHQDFSGKYCPHRTLDMGWQRFLNMVKAELDVLTPAPQPTPSNLYRVRLSWEDVKSQKGAFSNLNNAIECAKENSGYKVYDSNGKQVYPEVVVAPPAPEEMYRVRLSWEDVKSQVGAYKELENAKIKADEVASQGYKVYNSKGEVVYTPVVKAPEPKPVNPPVVTSPPVVEPPKPEPVPEAPKVAIMGKAQASAEQMAQLLLSKNPAPKIGISALKFAELFLAEGAQEGVKGDIAFCQAMHETGWLKFGGQVLPEQHNYAGIGATNNSPVGKGAWFDSEQLGIRAQIQHLKAYASKDALTLECVDPRFNLVTRGIAPAWTDLNGRWAVPGTTYGQSILAIYDELIKVVPEPVKEEPKPQEPVPIPTEPPKTEPVPEVPAPQETQPSEDIKTLGQLIAEFLMKLIELFRKKK